MFKRLQNFKSLGRESCFFWGARQSGKSTLLKQLFSTAPYYDLLLSDVFESEPHRVGEIQSRYYNMALRGATELAPLELLAFLKSIEKDLGREPDSHNMPRPIDIDILLYGNAVHESPELSIPHPRMHERQFVLEPLAQISPNVVHPLLKQPVSALLTALKTCSSCA